MTKHKETPASPAWHYQIFGMHCANCEVLLERKLKGVAGVNKVKVNHLSGQCQLFCQSQPILDELKRVVQAEGYQIELTIPRQSAPVKDALTKGRDYLETGAIFLVLAAAYFILKQFNLLPPGFGVKENMSYGLILLIGLVAAVSSCLAVTGGLLLALAAKYNEQHPELAGFRRFKPHLYFNFGRLLGYAFFGALVGGLGSLLSLSASLSSLVTILASLLMIIAGLSLLKLLPKSLGHLSLKLPKSLVHKIHDLSVRQSKGAAFILGALTFFLPCGFTLALQLYVLTKGSVTAGALTMLVFALGTLPSLISVGLLSSFVVGRWQRYFLKLAGLIVIIMGLFNINQGWSLAKVSQAPAKEIIAVDPNVQIINGRQVVKMKVKGYDYYPARFTVQAGLPVEWQIDGSQAAGCAKVIIMPALGLKELLSNGIKKITFTPTKTGRLAFSCSMGMTTPGAAFNVVAKAAGNQPAPQEGSSSTCDLRYANCLNSK